MTTAEEPITTVAEALRGTLHKTGDLIDSTHLHSLEDSGHEAASRLLAAAQNLTPRLGSAPVDSLRNSAARRAHQLAQSIDDGADALAPTKSGGRRWSWRILVLGLAVAATVYLSWKLTRGKTPSQREIGPPIGVPDEEAVAGDPSTGAAAGGPSDAGAATPNSKSSPNGTRAKKVEAQ
jgi:hypothetical protein